MTRKLNFAALLATSALVAATPALAAVQTTPAAPADQAQPDPSDAAADAAIAAAQPVDDAEAKIELLSRQVEALQVQLEAVKAGLTKATPTWKGAPELADKDAGFSFKPKGTMQFDAGYVGFPGTELRGTQGGINYANLGFNSRARRLIIGAEGNLPGGFGYNVEFNLAQGTLDYEDVLLSYQRKGSPVKVQIGNFYPLSSLETITSSKFTSFMERPAFTDGFNYNRRLGLSVALLDPKTDKYTLSAGIFSREINDTSFIRTGWEAGIRGTYTSRFSNGLLHFGASAHYRANNREALAQQYRARPLTQTTDQRFVDTGNIASKGDESIGLEVGGVFHSLHVAAEGQKLRVRHAYNAAQIALQNAVATTNDTIPGGAVPLNGDPSFEGGYAEVGYFFTGEQRGYKGGRWDRTKVLHPFDQGGWGAIQLNGRVDYLNLNHQVGTLSAANLAVANPNYVNGGKQLGYQLSLIWNPMDYVRFMAQYNHINVTGGPRAVSPLFAATSTVPIDQRKYSVDTAGVRAQLDF